MPQFDLNPNNPGNVVSNPSTGAVYQATPTGVKTLVAPHSAGSGGGGGSAVKSEPKKKKKGKKKRQPAKPEPYNPLTAPYMTPRQLREEAARLAALSVASEDTLRSENAREQAGLRGLTDSLSGTLADIGDRQLAGFRGLGNMYSSIAQAAQGAGQSAVAAAGAPTDIVQGASPMVAAQMANLAAPMTGYAPAAAATGTRLLGQSSANLTKALADRATRLSENTAKYLQQLRGEEIDRAVANTTAEQNAARLNLSAQGQAQDFAVDQANLGLRGQTVAQGWARLQQSADKAVAAAGKNRGKKIQAAKNSILKDIDGVLKSSSTGSGQYEFDVQYTLQDGSVQHRTVVAASKDEAEKKARDRGMVPQPSWGSIEAIQGKETPSNNPASRSQAIARVRAILINAGMTKAAANKWISANVLPLLPGAPSASSSVTDGSRFG